MLKKSSPLVVICCAIGLLISSASAASDIIDRSSGREAQAAFQTSVLQAERSLFRVGAQSGGAEATQKLADCIPYTECFSTVGILACLSLPTYSCCPWRYCIDFGDIPKV